MAPIPYGPHPEQVGDLRLPDGPGPHPVVVLWHGGSFAAEHGRDMLAPAAADLAARGWASWNVTYRRLGSGGGWPASFEDARAALAHLAELDAPLALGDVTALGFSAGFPLAFHAARHPGAVRARRLVDVAGVAALARGARLGGPGSGTWALLGDPDGAAATTYAATDPIAQLPLGIPALALHGDADALVPLAFSEAWVAAARDLGDAPELHVEPGAGHFDLHLPGMPGWAALLSWLRSTSASGTA
jgi:acetyl esterase/lipase